MDNNGNTYDAGRIPEVKNAYGATQEKVDSKKKTRGQVD